MSLLRKERSIEMRVKKERANETFEARAMKLVRKKRGAEQEVAIDLLRREGAMDQNANRAGASD